MTTEQPAAAPPPTPGELRVQAAVELYMQYLAQSVTTPSQQGPIVSVDLLQMLASVNLLDLQLRLVISCLGDSGLNLESFNQAFGGMVEKQAAALKKASDKPRILVPH